MRGWIMALAAAVPLASPGGAFAQEAGRDCPAGAAALPPELAGWAARRPMAAAAAAPGATLAPGSAIDAGLRRTTELRYVARPEKPGGTVSYGGLFAFTVKQAGTYRVALGAGAWIDVLAGGRPLTSSAHGHGPDCSGVRKMVDFPLEPGRYTLQVSANAVPLLPLMIVRLP